MRAVVMSVVKVDGRYVTAESEEGHHCGFGDVAGHWKPVVGETVTVEIDSDEYPVRVYRLGVLVWPIR